MNENMQAFLEKVSQDEEALERFKAIEDKEGIVALSEELGTPITLDDIEEQAAAAELSEDEAGDVAGGRMSRKVDGAGPYWKSDCFCVAGGGGTADGYQKTCACIAAGGGELSGEGIRKIEADLGHEVKKRVFVCLFVGQVEESDWLR